MRIDTLRTISLASHLRSSRTNMALIHAVLLLSAGLLFSARAEKLSDATLAKIGFEQKLNSSVSLDLPFRDESGTEASLGKFFHNQPVILVLGYYECPMLCNMVLNGMVESLQDIKSSIGKEFEVISVSINPRETAPLAAAKKRTYLKRYGRSGASEGWHFLTGGEPAIKQLAEEVGFQYAYDAPSKQYAHPSGLIILTPQGKVARYVFGVTFSPKELNAALKEASSNNVGSPVQQFILLCFHYNPIAGKYGALIMMLVRILAAATLLTLLWFIVTMVRREKLRALPAANP